MTALKGFCKSCMAMKPMVNPEKVLNRQGRPLWHGTCPDCGGVIEKTYLSTPKDNESEEKSK